MRWKSWKSSITREGLLLAFRNDCFLDAKPIYDLLTIPIYSFYSSRKRKSSDDDDEDIEEFEQGALNRIHAENDRYLPNKT